MVINDEDPAVVLERHILMLASMDARWTCGDMRAHTHTHTLARKSQ